MAVIARVTRYDPSVDEAPYAETFEVPVLAEGKWTALDILDYIRLYLDSSLSYYRHSTCNRGICARCAAQINGKTRLLCEYIVPANGMLVLAPIPGKNIVKDLVVR